MAQYQPVETGYDPGCLFTVENEGAPCISESGSLSSAAAASSTGSGKMARSPRRRDYKPTALRWYYHLTLIVSFAVLIGMTEYATRTLQLPSSGSIDLSEMHILANGEKRAAVIAAPRPFHARALSNTSSFYLELGTTTKTTRQSDTYLDGTTTDVSAPTEPSTTITTTGPGSGTITMTESSAYLEIGTTTIPTANTGSVTTTTAGTSAYLEIGTTTLTTAGTSAYLEIGTTTMMTIQSSAYDDVTTPAVSGPSMSKTTALSTDAGGYLNVGSITSVAIAAPTTQSNTNDAGSNTVASYSSQTGSSIPQITVIIVPQTITDSSSTITSERTLTDSAGQVTVETFETIAAGKPKVVESTMTISSLRDENQYATVGALTVIGSSKITFVEQTTIDGDGQTIVQTYQTTLPGDTSIMRSTISVSPGETLVVQPSVVQTTIGGTTEIVETALTDARGHLFTSSSMTVIGGTVSSSTIAVLMPTSIAYGDILVTLQEVVATTAGGVTKVLETTLTDAYGQVTTSSYTTVVGGFPTSVTIWTAIATSAPTGELIVTLPTVVPVTNGGSTEIAESISTDSQGALHTSFYTTVIGGTPTSTTLWTVVATHMPTQTSTSSTSPGTFPSSHGNSTSGSATQSATVAIYGITWKQYVLGTFLPTVIAVLISFPVKLIAINARLMQPFHALAVAKDSSSGSLPDTSIFLRFYSWSGSFSFLRAIKLGQPIIAISDVLTLGAGLLAPLAAEAIAVHTPDSCDSDCHGSLVASHVPSRVLEALMSVMVALLLSLVILLSIMRWKTGVSCNPWSIASMASMCLEPGFRKVLIGLPSGLAAKVDDSTISKALAGRTYALGEFWTSISPESRSRAYGVLVVDPEEGVTELLEDAEAAQADDRSSTTESSTQPFSLLTWWGRCIMLFVFSSILIILVYYENSSGNTGFERFMDSQGFAVRFFITAIGVLLGYCMETVFRCQYIS